jgi:excisionase family DNA binding protein
VTPAEAAHILGRSPMTVQRMIRNGELPRHRARAQRRLDRRDVERVAAERCWRPKRWTRGNSRTREGDSYRISSGEAGEPLGVTRVRVAQPAAVGRLPHLVTSRAIGSSGERRSS